MGVQENRCRIHCRGNQYLTGSIDYGELVKKKREVEQLKCEVLEKGNHIQAGNDGGGDVDSDDDKLSRY